MTTRAAVAVAGVACAFVGSLWLTSPQASAAPFRSCAEARAAGAAPLYAGQPGYSTKLDRDGDGVACETDGSGGGGSAPAPVVSVPPSAPPVAVQYALPGCYTSASPVVAQPAAAVLNVLGCRTLTLQQLTWSAWGSSADGSGVEVLQSVSNPVEVHGSNPQPVPAGSSCSAAFEYFGDVVVVYPKGEPPGRGQIEGPGIEYTSYDGMPAARYTGLTPDCS